ncbi:hypothetical protein H6P81_007984 [Aristolochia fimbriata]|uniref:Uncharacterized protein n=1 Tax=Aristolochia fimbriata TaxID=158543 RepID=A0AAV7F429_ARIFI|nr:hypothetical protein H6P81_007984 [Aristolochia fimbriata]
MASASSTAAIESSQPTVKRPLAHFPPSPWGYFFIDLVQDEQKLDEWTKRAQVLKEKVSAIIRDSRGAQNEAKLIDVIRRTGVEYQFEAEIEDALHRIYNNGDDVGAADHDHLYDEALRFRILREGGYKASASVFEKYKDEHGKKFKESITQDVKGLLSLYEAAFLGIRGEDILDEAIAFTTQHLRSCLATNSTLDPLLAKQIERVLEIPTHKRLPRLNARYFISFYEESEGKTSKVAMRTLLEYAKLDFNLVQALHQREIKEISMWWKEKGLAEKLSYARNRVVECYVWVMTLSPEPCFSRCRVFGATTLSMISMIDDTYDAYGVYEELKQFTSAIQRWDLAAMDELPQYVRPLYHELVTYFKACEEELEKERYQISYTRQAVENLCKCYFSEAEWYHNDYTPGTEEYIRVALISSGYPILFLLNMVFMKGISIESFQWWESQPRIVMAATEICRFIDDLASNTSSTAAIESSQPTVKRPLAHFLPSPWGYFFIDLVQDEQKLDEWTKRAQVLKEKVSAIIRDSRGAQNEAKLIDVIRHTDVEYQFEAEIEDTLHRIYNNGDDVGAADHDHLYDEALRFRILREGGYKASASVFEKYKVEHGKKFKESITPDEKGLLSLYEAAFLGIRGDDILDEAIAFTTQHLRSCLATNSTLDPLLAKHIERALEIPTHKRLPRLNARYFISFYEESEDKTSEVAMRTLLEYSKLDFNLVQALNQREIKEISINRVMECYVWVMTLSPEPCFSRCRVFGATTLSMISMIDDTYDAYDVYEELKQFTSAIQRWDLAAMDELPQYVRPLYHELVTYFKACVEELEKEGYQISYTRQAVENLCKCYFAEAEWYHNDYTPGTEEYIRVALISSGYPILFLLNMVFMNGVSIESFQWWESQPRIVMAAAEICRFIDNLASNSFEQERGHVVSGIECFIKEKGMTEEVHDLFIHFYNNAWKDINEACLRPRPFPMSILVKAVNLARVMDEWYYNPGEDAYTFSGGATKEMISKILVEPIPVSLDANFGALPIELWDMEITFLASPLSVLVIISLTVLVVFTSVRTARQVIDALNALGSEIDIILAEVDLPIAKGFKMLKHIMRDEELHRIPIIMMSSQDEVSVVFKCLRLGAADYLVKPLRTNELLNLWTHVWRRRRMLGLPEKNILNYDFDGAGSDPSDANTNSTTLFSDDTDDKTRRSNILETGVSNHPESDTKASNQSLLRNSLDYHHDTKTNNDVSGGISSCPKKSELKVGESSAFFTYVKANASTRSKSSRLGCPEDNTSQPEDANNGKRFPMMHRQVDDVNRHEDKKSWEYSIHKNGFSCNNAAEIHSKESLCAPSVPLESQQGWNMSKEELTHSAQLQPSNEFRQADILGVPSLARMPFYLPPVMSQMMIPSSAQSQGSPHDVPKHATSASMSHYNGAPLPHCAHMHMNMMGSFPYYHSVNLAMQPGQMPPAPSMWPSAVASTPTEMKSDQVERRERALIKFRKKRKDRCFTKQIRYASRKQLAERRPRFRGQFVKECDGSNLSLNGHSAADDDDSDTDEEVDENEEASEF